MKPNFLILIPHFEEWARKTKTKNFTISSYDIGRVVASLESGYAFVRTRFLNKNAHDCRNQGEDDYIQIINYTYEYAYRDICGLVNISNPDDQTTLIRDIEDEIEQDMISDGNCDY